MIQISKIALFREYTGLLIFLASLCISIQLAWVIEHDRPDEILSRLIVAGLAALLIGIVLIWTSHQFLSERAQSLARHLSQSLWPGFLLLFTPFHVLLLCRWQNQCDYWGDFFVLQFVVFMVVILFATVHKGPVTIFHITKQKLANAFLIRFVAKHQYLFAFILALAILLFRGWGRFIHPEFFAEGGTVFLAGALSDGWRSLFDTYAGFLHFFPRLIVLIGLSTAPIQHLAQFTVAVCFLVAASINAFIVRSEYRWIIPSDTARWGICVLLCLAPGLFEMLGNLPNMHYMLFMLVGIILLKDPASTISPVELIIVALIALSTGLVVTLVPLALFRVMLKKYFSQKLFSSSQTIVPAIWSEWVLLSMLLIPTLWSITNIFLDPASPGIETSYISLHLGDLFDGLINVSVIYFLLFPLAGNIIINEMLPYISPVLLFILLVLIFAKLFYSHWQENQISATFIVLWLTAMIAVPVMIFILRPNGFVFFLIDQQWGNFAWWMRYNYLVAVPGILLWFILLRPDNLSLFTKKTSVFILIILSSGIFHAQYIFPIGRYTEKEFWKEASSKLQKSFDTGCPKEVFVEIYPEAHFQYSNPKSEELNCE